MNLKESLDVIKKHWHSTPVDVLAVARDLGVPVQAEVLPDNISGCIKLAGNGGYFIIVNRTHALVRQRFTVAHELGHFIYHRDLLGRGVGDTRAYRAEGTDLPNPHITLEHERQANTFAANLLMPKHLIEKLQKEGLHTPAELAQKLLVSEQAMRIRLGYRPEYVPPPDDDTVEVRRGGVPLD